MTGNPDLGWWYLDDLEIALTRTHTLKELNDLMAPLKYKHGQKKKGGRSCLQATEPKVKRSTAQQTSWHYERGRKKKVIHAEGGWRLPDRDAELKERPGKPVKGVV